MSEGVLPQQCQVLSQVQNTYAHASRVLVGSKTMLCRHSKQANLTTHPYKPLINAPCMQADNNTTEWAAAPCVGDGTGGGKPGGRIAQRNNSTTTLLNQTTPSPALHTHVALCPLLACHGRLLCISMLFNPLTRHATTLRLALGVHPKHHRSSPGWK